MWRAPNAKKHALPLLGEPSVKEAQAARWFQPVQVGRLTLRTRTWVPAMVPWRASDDGFVTQRVIDWYARFAQGKPGALVIEATGIRDVPSGPLLRIGHERFVPGLTRLVSAIREASEGETKVFIQLIDFLSIRRRPLRDKFLSQHLTISDRHRALTGLTEEPLVRRALLAMDEMSLREVLTSRELEALDYGARERVTDLEVPQIRELPQVLPKLFAEAALRAEQAGFDGVELHMAHAYTLASFLSARNTRDDGYGGSLEGRLRLPLEVLREVRARLSKDSVVGLRMLSDEIIPGGSTPSDAAYFATELARAQADFISLSRGGKFEDAKQPKVGHAAYPYTGPSGWECMPTVVGDAQGPFGRNLTAAKQIRSAVRGAGFATPIVVAGGIASFEQAEQALSEGCADIVASARQTLADPDWFTKLRTGRALTIRRCTFTNYCEGLDQMHKPVTCKLWDREGLGEPGLDIHEGRRLTAPLWVEEHTS